MTGPEFLQKLTCISVSVGSPSQPEQGIPVSLPTIVPKVPKRSYPMLHTPFNEASNLLHMGGPKKERKDKTETQARHANTRL